MVPTVAEVAASPAADVTRDLLRGGVVVITGCGFINFPVTEQSVISRKSREQQRFPPQLLMVLINTIEMI